MDRLYARAFVHISRTRNFFKSLSNPDARLEHTATVRWKADPIGIKTQSDIIREAALMRPEFDISFHRYLPPNYRVEISRDLYRRAADEGIVLHHGSNPIRWMRYVERNNPKARAEYAPIVLVSFLYM